MLHINIEIHRELDMNYDLRVVWTWKFNIKVIFWVNLSYCSVNFNCFIKFLIEGVFNYCPRGHEKPKKI